MTTIRQDIQRHIDDYLRFTRYARWLVIGLVLTSLVIIPGQPVWSILAIAAAAISFNVLSLLGDHIGWGIFSNRPLILQIDTIAGVGLVAVTGGQDSMYLPVLLFVIVSSAYWYGASIAVAIAAVECVLVATALALIQGAGTPDAGFVLPFIIFATIGLYLSWLTESERSERTQLLNISAESERQRQQLLALINSISDAVIVADPDGKVLLTNTATGSIIDQAKIIQGAHIEGLLKLTDASGKALHIKLKHIKQAVEHSDLSLVAVDGSRMRISLKLTPYVVNGTNQGYIWIVRDITRERTIEQERLEFIAVAQHELRTPLTVAEGTISMALSPEYAPKDPAVVEMLEMGFRSLRQLSHIVTDLTTLAKAQADQLDPAYEPVDIHTIYQELSQEHAAEAEQKDLQLILTIDDDVQPIITSRYVVYEILANFVSNAIKFTDKGSVELLAQRRGQGLALSIRDTGRGISTSDHKKLFSNFFQSEDWRTRDHGGTGLGLYIAQKLAGRISAQVSCQSRLGKGSTFTLDLPAYSRHAQDQAKVAEAETKGFFNYL